MKIVFISWMLVFLIVGCQSNDSRDSRIPLFEARPHQPISVSLRTRDKEALKIWGACHTRDVWFDVKDSQGRKMTELVLFDVFWSKRVAEPPRHDATEFKVHVQSAAPVPMEGVAMPFVIGKGTPMVFGKWIEKPGTYLLEFHVDCYDRKHRLLYSSTTEKIRCHISDPTFLEKRSCKEASEITLWVSRNN